MPNFIMTEGSARFKTLYGDYNAPIVSCIEDVAQACEEESIVDKIFRQQSSAHWAEGYSSTTAMDPWEPVGENGAHPQNGFVEGYDKTLQNETWKSQFAISRELVDDCQIGKMQQRATKFTKAYYRTREEFGASLLGGAIAGDSTVTRNGRTFDVLGADGLTLFNTAHVPKVSGANQTNKYADAFSQGALFKGITAYQNLCGENGELLSLCPDTILIPNDAALKEAVMACLASFQKPGTGDNDINPLLGSLDIIVWPYLNKYCTGATTPWFLMDRSFNDMADGLVMQNRVPLEITNKEGDNDESLWNGYARFTGGFVDWRAIMGFGLTGGSSL